MKEVGHRPEEVKGHHCLAPPLGQRHPKMRQKCCLLTETYFCELLITRTKYDLINEPW